MSNTFEITTITDEMQESITFMAQKRNALIAFTKEVLVKDQDYGVVPGVQKPTLLKPGAEKLMNLYNLSVEFECTDKVMDLSSRFVAYTYKATVKSFHGRIVTQCEGSVNSYEPKYRYLWLEKPKPSQAVQDQMKAAGNGKFRKTSGGWVWVERTENPDLVGLQNTMQKMAQKRAFVGAILIATNASEFFTQDVEDMGFIDVESTVVENPATKTPALAKDEKKAAAKPASKAAPVAPVTSAIPEETKSAINGAKDVASLYLIHKNNVALQSDETFIKMLSTKKAEIRKAVAAQ